VHNTKFRLFIKLVTEVQNKLKLVFTLRRDTNIYYIFLPQDHRESQIAWSKGQEEQRLIYVVCHG